MLKINHFAVFVAAVAAFVVSTVWYIVFGNAWMELRGVDPSTMVDMAMPAWKMLAEFARASSSPMCWRVLLP